MRKLIAALGLAAGIAGCNVLATTQPFDLGMTALPSTVTLGDTMSFSTFATATSLTTLTIAYGDGTSDSNNAQGAHATTVVFKHVYKTRGTFSAKLTVIDAQQGSKSATTSVQVN